MVDPVTFSVVYIYFMNYNEMNDINMRNPSSHRHSSEILGCHSLCLTAYGDDRDLDPDLFYQKQGSVKISPFDRDPVTSY